MRNYRTWVLLVALTTSLSVVALAQSAVPFRLQTNYMTGLSSPVLLTNAKDGTRRIFIVERAGTIKVAPTGSSTTTNFMVINTRVLSGGERGLLGLAFHPQFATNSYFFVNYTRQTDGATVISRFRATNGNSIGDPNSERILMTIPQPFSNHNGGMIEFREDAPGVYNLYIGLGDGGSGNDPGNRSQNINEPLGKFLRITPNATDENPSPPYTIPADNPYVGVNGADEIYAVGVRNPWRWSFDRGGSNQLWAADVGQNAREEVSIINLAQNYGWRVYEGTNCTGLDPILCVPANFTMPEFEYVRASPRCSITGGYVYRGVQNAVPKGAYIYGDYCSGEILMWRNGQQALLQDTSRNISSFGEDEDGELYVVGLGGTASGTVDKMIGNKTSADFDGDLRTDISVFRPSTGLWYVQNSQNSSVTVQQFGVDGDIPTAKDFDGDFKADLSVFRPSNGTWYFLRSSDSTFGALQFGSAGDVPVSGDYDGDGKADLVLFRPSTGLWYKLRSSDSGIEEIPFGQDGDIPTPGDFDGDGRYDIALWRPSNGVWYRMNSSNGSWFQVSFGSNGDIPASGDFDGDLKNDLAVFRPSNGTWYTLQSSNSAVVFTQWGAAGDIPVVGDYDGDFKDDIAVFRPSSGLWYIRRSQTSTVSIIQFGINGDLPIPSYDVP